MTELRATLTSQGGTLDLDQISMDGKGVEAVAGATGFGLPSVDVQWVEGAGHGARAVGSRVQARDIELPLWIEVDTRAELKARLRTMAMVVAEPMTLTLMDPDGPDLEIDVVRVGGGEYASGEDTDGRHFWRGQLILRAGDPFWRWTTATLVTRSGSGALAVTNDGTAPGWPKWTASGPLSRVTITTPDGELDWAGNLPQGQTLVLDTRSGTVADGQGTNRYDGLAAAPRFRTMRPGTTSTNVDFAPLVPAPRYNLWTNPRFRGDVSDWTVPFSAGKPVSTTIAGRLVLLGETMKIGDYPAAKTITGLPPGETLQIRVWCGGYRYNPDFGVRVPPAVIFEELGFGGYGQIAETFTVPANGKLTIRLMSGSQPNGSVVMPHISSLYIGKPGSYFDGTTPAADGYSYAWAGAPDASQSIETPPPVSGTPSLTCELTPREWMVI